MFDPLDTPPPLESDEVHVWLLGCADLRPAAVATATRCALDRLLAAYAGLDLPPAIERGEHGKPFAPAWPDLQFNLSHSGQHVLLAFADRQPLGVDLERRDRRVSHAEIAQRFFAPSEAAAIMALAPEQRADVFQHLWTNKEAVLKALGAGLNFGLSEVEFEIDGKGEVGELRRLRPAAGELGDWNVHRLRPSAELIGALAWRGPPRRLRTFEMSGELARRSLAPDRHG